MRGIMASLGAVPRDRPSYPVGNLMLSCTRTAQGSPQSSAVAGVPLAAYGNAPDHGRVCRDDRIINTVSLFLEGKKPLRMTPRSPDDSAERRGRRYFEAWDGDPATLAEAIA